MSDGADPSPDLAVRERSEIDGFWRLAGTSAEQVLRPPVEFVDSQVDGLIAKPATKEAIGQWFSESPLRSGDTLLLYVTDHGTRNADDPSNNAITLWGVGEDLRVNDLRAMLSALPRDVRVVSVMSQCFSGGFAQLASGSSSSANGPTVCGYFSSTPDRPAYGCYPENRGLANVGHAFHFLGSFSDTGQAAVAHERTLVADDTPDVPLRTSDVFLEALLTQIALNRGVTVDATVDALLQEAWRDAPAWQREIRLLDAIAHRFGYSSPRSLAALTKQASELPAITDQLRRVSQAWKSSLHDDNRSILSKFLASTPDRNPKLQPETTASLNAIDRQLLATDVVAQLSSFSHLHSASLEARAITLHDRSTMSAASLYRMEVRLAALLRLRTVLTTIAGRQLLRTDGNRDNVTTYDQLFACEDLRILAASGGRDTLPQSASFPSFEDDVDAAQAALPSFIGIQFRPLESDRRRALQLKEGAAIVLAVYPDSPAAAAAVAVGDIIVGANGKRFEQPNEVRTWTMLTPPSTAATVQVIREKKMRQVRLMPAPYPMRWPELPGPPKVSQAAPTLHSTSFRGTVPATLADGRRHLLFFWATWCAICKTALPEVLAFAEQTGTEVIAITDEPATQLEKFFGTITFPFPHTIAIDDLRRDFSSYGVSGTPSFVLIDGNGNIESFTTGYSAQRGIGAPGWTWTRPTTPP